MEKKTTRKFFCCQSVWLIWFFLLMLLLLVLFLHCILLMIAFVVVVVVGIIIYKQQQQQQQTIFERQSFSLSLSHSLNVPLIKVVVVVGAIEKKDTFIFFLFCFFVIANSDQNYYYSGYETISTSSQGVFCFVCSVLFCLMMNTSFILFLK